MAESWESLKKEAEQAYRNADFAVALKKYELSFDVLCKTVPNGDEEFKKREGAKILCNCSLMNIKLFEESSNADDDKFLERALKFALQSLTDDAQWPKGHLRLSQIHYLRKDEDAAVESMRKFLSMITVEERNGAVLLHMSKLKYFTHTSVMAESPSWNLVKFPNNVYSIDQNGAGHFEDMRHFLAALWDKSIEKKNGTSVLVQPGVYYGVHILPDSILDIVGNCKVEIDKHTGAIEDDPPVVFQNVHPDQAAKLNKFQMMMFNTFTAASSCKVYFSRVSLMEVLMEHPINCINARDSSVNLLECSLRSICSASVSCINSRVTMKSCRSIGAYGVLLACDKSESIIENCFMKGNTGMAIEVRENSKCVEVINCTISDCCKQAVAANSGTKKAIVRGCLFERTCLKKTINEGAIQLRCCDHAHISETTLRHNKGAGIVIEGGSGKFENLKISSCMNGMLIQAPVYLSGSSITSCVIGVNISAPIEGNVVLSRNTIKECKLEIASLPQSPTPIFRGASVHKVTVMNINNLATQFLKDQRHQRRENRKNFPDLGAVGDVLGMNIVKNVSCDHCTLSEGQLGYKFQACSGCRCAMYCSETCQKEDFEYHEPMCLSLQDRMKVPSKKVQKLAKEEIEGLLSDATGTNKDKDAAGPSSRRNDSPTGSTSENREPSWKNKNQKKKKKKGGNF